MATFLTVEDSLQLAAGIFNWQFKMIVHFIYFSAALKSLVF